MTDLIINGTAAMHSSLGARRYFEGVLAHLDWPGRVIINPPATNPRFARVNEMCERGRRDAIYWSPAHRGPLFAHNHVVTVLDCINLEHTYANDWRLQILRANFRMLMSGASKVVAISNATKNSLLRNRIVSPDKIVVIPGPTDLPLSAARCASRSIPRQDDQYVLMITNSLPHKNTVRAVRALASSAAPSQGVSLRVVGSISAEGRAACANAKLRVEEYRGIDDATLDEWISQSRFLFSPSLDEGLNLPISDAVRLGANVLCSDIAVHREFYDGSVEFFDPLDTDAMRVAVDRALKRDEQWFPFIERPQFGIAAVASKYKQIFLDIF